VIKVVFIKGDYKFDIKAVEFDELSKIFQKCHDSIWEGGKNDPATAFDEFSKLLMAKIFDERFTPVGDEYQFQIKANEPPEEVGNKIKKLYEDVKEKNNSVFKSDLKTSDEVIFDVVKNIQKISLRTTDLDIKGRAFENFLGKTFRDEYGQYFTPRNVVRFMVGVINPTENDLIIDPACGSGGFLLYSMMHVIQGISKKYGGDKDSLNRISWEFAHKQLFGIEINDRIARIAMMDMIIHEDGHSNIECNNGLEDYENYKPERNIKAKRYSILLTNPPFGSIVKKNNILKNYNLGNNRTSQKTEILFLERCLDLLKEGGKLGIVLPDSILTNSTLRYVRDYILDNSKVIAIISLPQHAFVPSGAAVKSSLLFLEKSSHQEDNYPVFMAIAKKIGYDARNEKEEDDLIRILDEWNGKCIIEKERRISFFKNEQDILENFSPEQFITTTNHKDWERVPLDDLCDGRIFTGTTPSRNKYTDEGNKIIKVRDLTGKGIDWDNFERGFVPKDFFLKKSKHVINEDDILFITAAHHPKYIGKKIEIVDTIPSRFQEGVLCTAEIMVLRINAEIIDPYYVYSFLKSSEGYTSMQSCIRGQTAHIYSKDIKNILIQIPPHDILSSINEELKSLRRHLSHRTESTERFTKTLDHILSFIEET